MTLVDALAAAAEDLEGVEATEPSPGTTEWSVDGQTFAAVTGMTAQFRLEPLVAKAALGTPDTVPSGRGPEWVAFGPHELDRFALDRATAWLASAYRNAGGPTE